MKNNITKSTAQERAPNNIRPTLDFREKQRRLRLHRVRHNVETVLRHPVTDLDPDSRAQVERAVALLIAEIAILDRVLKPGDGDEYVERIGQTLGIDVAPSVALWMSASSVPMAQFRADWSAHAERATRLSEVRHQHRHLLDPDVFGPLLNLTRARIKEVFGTVKCSIKPVKARLDRFDRDTAKMLNAVADEMKLARERVRDLYADRGEAGLDDLRRQHAKEVDRLVRATKKRGRPRKDETVRAMVATAARQTRLSCSTIYERLSAARAISDPSEVQAEAMACGVSETEVHLSRIVASEPNRGRRKVYIEREAVIAHHTAEHGKPPTKDAMRHWMARGQWVAKAFAAKAWQATLLSPSSARQKCVKTLNKLDFSEPYNGHSARPFRASHDNPAREGASDQVDAEASDSVCR